MPRPSSRFSTVNSWDSLSLLIQSFSRSRRCTMSVAPSPELWLARSGLGAWRGLRRACLHCLWWRKDGHSSSLLLCWKALRCRLRHTVLVCRRWGRQPRQTGRSGVLESKCSDRRKGVSRWCAHARTSCSPDCHKGTFHQAVAPSLSGFALSTAIREGRVDS